MPAESTDQAIGLIGPSGAGAPSGSPFQLQIRGPATDTQNGVCHVNAQIPMQGDRASRRAGMYYAQPRGW
jgi:hypothetical protein